MARAGRLHDLLLLFTTAAATTTTANYYNYGKYYNY